MHDGELHVSARSLNIKGRAAALSQLHLII